MNTNDPAKLQRAFMQSLIVSSDPLRGDSQPTSTDYPFTVRLCLLKR
jgi:hypothetical protein